jgi:hypothetical protein
MPPHEEKMQSIVFGQTDDLLRLARMAATDSHVFSRKSPEKGERLEGIFMRQYHLAEKGRCRCAWEWGG